MPKKRRQNQSGGQRRRARPPVRGYADMIGWPGTLPPRRLRELLAIMKSHSDPGGDRILEDLGQVIITNHCHQFSGTIHPELEYTLSGAPTGQMQSYVHLRRMTDLARRQDTPDTIGGILTFVPGNERTESRMLFKLNRHPEWIGANPLMPLLRGLNVTISPSIHFPLQPGLIVAEPDSESFPPGTSADMPSEECD